MIKRKMEMSIQPADALIEDDKDDIVSKYINPNPNCLCCNVPDISLKINQAYLNGKNYKTIIEEFSDEIKQKLGKKLDYKDLSDHFNSHFNHRGVAIAEYNRKYGMNQLVPTEQKQMRNIFTQLVGERINDLELLDLAMKEQIKRLKELEDLKQDRIEQKRTYQLDQLIMKQEAVTNNISTQLLSKLKIYQKAQFQSKQLEVMDKHLQFLDHKTASFLGLDSTVIEPTLAKEAERMYLKVVIENLVKRIKTAMDIVFKFDAQEKAQYFKELNRQFKGIENIINVEFQERLQNLKNIKEVP